MGRENATAGPYRFSPGSGVQAEKVMAAYCKTRRKTRTSHKLGVAALFACLSAPTLAETVPLPAPRPALLQARPNSTGSVVAPTGRRAVPVQALNAWAQAPQKSQAPNPVSNPF